MSPKEKAKSPKRGERHSAAWGKRWSLLLLVLVAEAAFAQNWEGDGRPAEKFAPELAPVVERAHRGTAANQTVRVIVQYKHVPQAEHEGRMQRLGARLGHRLGMVNGLAATIPASALPALEADPEVVSVSVDHPLQGFDDINDTAVGNNASLLPGGWNGTGIGVAVIDSGINDSSLDFWNSTNTKSRVVYRQDFTGQTNKDAHGHVIYDTYGHGTHVAGIIGGNGYHSGGTTQRGMATNVNLIDLRVLDANGGASDSIVIAAIQKAIALKSTYNIRIINLSLGRAVLAPYGSDPLCQAVESAWKSGIVVVVAAGNYGRVSLNGSNGYGTIAAPGNDPYVITVGGMKTMQTFGRADDRIASYSSKGPTTFDHVVKPDIVAPGNYAGSVIAPGSTLVNEYPGNIILGTDGQPDYFQLSGTSMATPIVSGSIALLLQKYGSLTPDQVKARLMKSAYKTFPATSVATDPLTGQTYTSNYDMFTVGAGYLDLPAAFANTDLAPATVGSALSPTATYSSKTNAVTLSNGNSQVASNSVVWGSSVVWGTSVVWGANVTGNSVVWGSSVVWGTSSSAGFSVVWGTTSSSANSVVWGTSVSKGDAAFVTTVGEN